MSMLHMLNMFHMLYIYCSFDYKQNPNKPLFKLIGKNKNIKNDLFLAYS